MRNVQYVVNTGVDYSHRKMNTMVFERLRDAVAYFEERKVSGHYSTQCGELVRLRFPCGFGMLEEVKIIKTYGIKGA